MFSSLGRISRIILVAALVSITAPLACATAADAQPPAGDALIARYALALAGANARLPLAARRDLAEHVLLLSSYYNLDPCLLGALVSVESAWRARAVSPVGALGYGQLMPGTASALRVDPLEPYENLDGTARYLRRMLNRFAGRDQALRIQLALASYNAGAGAVDRYHGVPPYRETRAYVANVLRTRDDFVASIGSRKAEAAAPVPGRITLTPHLVRFEQRATHREARRFAFTNAPKRWYHTPSMDALERSAAYPPPAVRYERSRSFVARFLGLRHRVAAPAAAGHGGVP